MTSTHSTYVAHNIPDLLDMMPALFGFTPQESFIAIATFGKRHSLGFRLRMDIPSLGDVPRAALQVAAYLRRQGPNGVILVALTGAAEAGDALMAAVIAELDDIPVEEAVRATADQYWTYCNGRPDAPVPYVGGCSEVVVDAILAGRQILPDRDALVAKFAAVTGERRDRMRRVTDHALSEAVHVMTQCPTANLGAAGMARLAPIIDAATPDSGLADAELATLAVWVSSRQVRDEVWSRMDRANAQASFDLWTAVAQSVVEPFEPPVLCLAGFAAWLAGDGAQALIATERALAIQPDYLLAGLVLDLIMSAMPPDDWKGFDPECHPIS